MEDIKKALFSIAPTIATAIGGPLAGAAISLLSSSLGISDELPQEQKISSIKEAVSKIDSQKTLQILNAEHKFSLEVMNHEYNKLIEQNRNNNIQAEAKSNDSFISRARPSFLYIFYFIILVLVIFMPLVGVFFPEGMISFFRNVRLGFEAIPHDLWYVFGAGYLGYGGYRTYEKVKGVNKIE